MLLHSCRWAVSILHASVAPQRQGEAKWRNPNLEINAYRGCRVIRIEYIVDIPQQQCRLTRVRRSYEQAVVGTVGWNRQLESSAAATDKDKRLEFHLTV